MMMCQLVGPNYLKVKYVFGLYILRDFENSPYILINIFKIPKIIRTILQSHAKRRDQKHI